MHIWDFILVGLISHVDLASPPPPPPSDTHHTGNSDPGVFAWGTFNLGVIIYMTGFPSKILQHMHHIPH